MKGYIFSDQLSLYGKRDVVGYDGGLLMVREISKNRADNIIRKHHYSHKIVNGSYLHFGVYIDGDLVGALQFGPAMNPASGGSVVRGATVDTFLELNRMWLSDTAGRNSESMAIAYCIKCIRAIRPKTQWIQSFADERCGGLGIVYQAANFEYYGAHTSTFWELDGIVYHNIAMTRKKGIPKEVHLQNNRDRATSYDLRQFRYIYWIDQRQKKNILLTRQPYPKHYAESKEASDTPTE